jgi:hypothetical protein
VPSDGSAQRLNAFTSMLHHALACALVFLSSCALIFESGEPGTSPGDLAPDFTVGSGPDAGQGPENQSDAATTSPQEGGCLPGWDTTSLGGCYRFVQSASGVAADVAQDLCVSDAEDAHLAVVSSLEEYDLLATLYEDSDAMWIGARYGEEGWILASTELLDSARYCEGTTCKALKDASPGPGCLVLDFASPLGHKPRDCAAPLGAVLCELDSYTPNPIW